MEKANKKIIFLTIFVIVFLIGTIIAAYSRPPKTAEGKIAWCQILKNQPQNDTTKISGPFFGAENPKITIIEFSDFVCPYCKNSQASIRQLGLKYEDSVKIIYKDLPLHENSEDLAMAARCAGEQNLFWSMYDKLFAKQGKFTLEQLPNLAAEIGADAEKFKTCLETKKYAAEIEKDIAEAKSLNTGVTPTFFVNGYQIKGDLPLSSPDGKTASWEEIMKCF